MANITRNFTAGKMNKVVDERLVPNGEYIDAMNVRMGSTENSEIGTIENTKGNLSLTTLAYPIDGTPLSTEATTIGAIEDGSRETIYWFVHDPEFVNSATGKLDMIVSFNVLTNILTYHVVSTDDGGGVNTTLNFNPKYLITGVNLVDRLLFFTDDYNAPRKINITRSYAYPIGYVDQITDKELLVIKQPPIESPTFQTLVIPNEDNFMEDRFICFAYRYRYADNEYSAISQFTEPCFIPGKFNFDLATFLNTGMQNTINGAIINYNSGDELVVGVDLLFKEAGNDIIKVIEKLDKQQLGMSDNTNYQYTFSNSKIFTVLPDYEILRLYDNVPRYAKAQTIMGNRLMYGNYVEGYDLIDKYGNPLKNEYFTNLVSEEINVEDVPEDFTEGNYSIDGPIVGPLSVLEFDLAGLSLDEGALLNINFTLTHGNWTGNTTPPTSQTNAVEVSFTFILPTSYTSVYALATSPEFVNAIGSALSIYPVYTPLPQPTSCDGYTLTDLVNCELPSSLGAFSKYASGISADGQPIQIISSPASSVIGLQMIAMKYVTDVNTPTSYVYEYYNIAGANVSFQNISSTQSLHSNRGYELGIVYMDEFNRSSTALTSNDNTEFVPCGYSANKNSIQAIIPPQQVAPYWATRYKFVIKADAEKYETIYSTLFFISPTTGDSWFLLEGQNSRKVEVGDRLIVKADSSGATTKCRYATVLDKQAQEENFLTIPSQTNPSSNITVPAGVYIRLNTNDFNAVFDENSVYAPGEKTQSVWGANLYPTVQYDIPASLDIPAGSRIRLLFEFERLGTGDGNGNCETRTYFFDKTFTASADYSNFIDWWNGALIGSYLNDGDAVVGDDANNCDIDNVFLGVNVPTPSGDLCTNYYWLAGGSGAPTISLYVKGTVSCSGLPKKKTQSTVKVNIEIYRNENTFIFETEPSDTLPDVFFENDLSFAIDSLGQHQGNVANQNFATGQPAVVDTQFFNCFAFGNGAESYKVLDSITGKEFNFGNRVHTVSAQDYKEADRFADMTYSGVYNDESNLNKLNEFNLGLLNFKPLEDSFGPIYILDARQTDVLVLQEDKISYVLAGKNLLSDAAAGSALTSVPEVLGTQIARVEKYGISFNPESYVQWGENRYFTDAKRGAVLNLKDGDTGMSQLQVISEFGMRTWFRDEFNRSFNTQKLGAYDPYLNEYVLSSNDRLLPDTQECLECGQTQVFAFTEAERQFNYCVNVGAAVGDLVITYNVINLPFGNDFEIETTYNGVTETTGQVTTSGTITIDKDSNTADVVDLNLYTSGVATIEITVSCPVPNTLTIVEVVLTNDSDGGQTTRVEYRYTDGAYIGSLQSALVSFQFGASNPLVSRYNAVSGFQGTPGFPTNGSTMRMANNQFGFATFVFDPTSDKFKYLRTNTLYNNTSAELYALLAAANTATPINGGGTYYYADFNVGASGDYLYLIWDYRQAVPTELCFDTTSVTDVCCNCEPCEDLCSFWSAANIGEGTAEVQYHSCSDGEIVTISIPENEVASICGRADYSPQVLSGTVRIETEQQCGCPS